MNLGKLIDTLHRIDGSGYGAYKRIRGEYQAFGFTLVIDHTQPDPYAPPSRVRVRLSSEKACFPSELWSSETRRRALADYLGRGLAAQLETDRDLTVYRPGQKVLNRTNVLIDEGHVEARFQVALPARGRRIMGRRAAAIFDRKIPELVESSLVWGRLDQSRARAHVLSVEDQQALRAGLEEMGLVGFVARGAILPRRSGIDDRPLEAERGPVLFDPPESLIVELETPNSGPIRGLGIPPGVTLIVGGGFHGKSTLLRALEQGVYDHLPGDGRERVVTIPTATKIRSEDGRAVTGVDISPFINDLPGGRATESFSTANASGSTSQAAAIMEALEMGTGAILMDEDTSATNFMIRDRRMQLLVAKEKEPITPFLDRVRELSDRHGVSTILVMGGSGDYLDMADTVILMDNYRPSDITAKARRVARDQATGRSPEPRGPFEMPAPRCFQPDSFRARRGKREVSIRAKGLRRILYGSREIDLDGLDQLVEEGQTRVIGAAIHQFGRLAAEFGLKTGLEKVWSRAAEDLDRMSPYPVGNLALPRPEELAQALNRLRSLKKR